MEITTQVSGIDKIAVSTLVKFCYSGDYRKDNELKTLDSLSGGAIKNLYDSGEFTGQLNQSAVLHTPAGIEAARVVLVGIGEKKSINNDCYRQAAGTISGLPAVKKSQSLAFRMQSRAEATAVTAVIEGYMLGSLVLDDYKTKKG